MTSNKTILYVEDNLDNRVLIRRILMAEGYNVMEAENAEQAIRVVHEQTPDLILMDINMPDVDGYSLTLQMKSLPDLSDIPVIAVTANVMKGDREKTLQAGCDGYIQKPVDIDVLPKQIAQFLQR